MPFRGGATSVESSELHARRLHALFDRLPALIAYWDRDCRNVIANAPYVEWFGRSPEEIHGIHIREVLGAEVYAKNLPFITGVLNGEEQLFERTLVDMAGNVRHTQASYVPDIVAGECVGFFVLVTDVTPRVEAQRAMDEAQRLAQLGSWSMDVSTGVITWSDELYRIFGVERESFVPTVEGLLERVDPRDLDLVQAQLKKAREAGDDYGLTYRILRPDGRTCEVYSRGHPVKGKDGLVTRMTGTLQDVTATNVAARELARVNRELRTVNQLNADVLAMLGHDVRAPLSVILGYLEELTVSWDDTSEDQRRQHLERTFAAARRLRGLVDDILAMATVDAGQIETRPVSLSARDLVRDVVEGVGAGPGISLRATGDPQVHADAFHLRQVVSNLLINARRYGEPPIEIVVEPGPEDTVTITVSDHGAGVPQDQVPHLFERFAGRGPGRSGTDGSTGFGLYIAARLAAANRGSVAYEPGEPGARFRLTVPAAPPREAPDHADRE